MGMVFTHVLIVGIHDIASIINLERIFSYFVDSIPEHDERLEPIEHQVDSFKTSPPTTEVLAYIQQSATKILIMQLPVIFCGELLAFKNAICKLWHGLPIHFRKALSYTAGFTTTSFDQTKTFLYFQKDLAPILKSYDYISDEETEAVMATTTVGRFILLPNAVNELNTLMEALEVVPESWESLQLLVKVSDKYLEFEKVPADELRLFIRQVAMISPDAKKGMSIKSRLIGRLAVLIRSGKEENWKSLKNLPLTAFAGGVEAISKAFSEVLITNFAAEEGFRVKTVSELIEMVVKDGTRNWWHEAIRDTFNNAFKSAKTIYLGNIWKLLLSSQDVLISTSTLIGTNAISEKNLLSSIPTEIPAQLANTFAKICRDSKWQLLHAALLPHFLAIKQAALYQLEMDISLDDSSNVGTKSILPKLSNLELLDLAIETGQEVFCKEYALRAVMHPDLLNNIDISNKNWLAIWSLSLPLTKNISHGIPDAGKTIDDILSRIADQELIPNTIVEAIAESNYADMSQRKDLTAILSNLGENYKIHFVKASAMGAMNTLLNSDHAVIAPAVLAYIKSDDFMTSFLQQNKVNIDNVLNAYEKISELKDQFLSNYIRIYTPFINEIQSARLGRLVLSKNFSVTAEAIFEKAKLRDDFRIALNGCAKLVQLNLFERFKYGHLFNHKITKDDVYLLFEQTAAHLYKQGPEQNNIWERAGGDLSQLYHHKTRGENWGHAIALLRNGGGGKYITERTLIKEMLKDYHSNSQLSELLKYF